MSAIPIDRQVVNIKGVRLLQSLAANCLRCLQLANHI
jgi:hypothetical protein